MQTQNHEDLILQQLERSLLGFGPQQGINSHILCTAWSEVWRVQCPLKQIPPITYHCLWNQLIRKVCLSLFSEDFFFPFGDIAGDERLSQNHEESENQFMELISKTFEPPAGFPLWGEFFYKLYVNAKQFKIQVTWILKNIVHEHCSKLCFVFFFICPRVVSKGIGITFVRILSICM